MRTIIAINLLLLFSTPVFAGQVDPELDVRAAVANFGRAFQEADAVALGSLLTDDYVHVNGSTGNVIGRDAWLDWVASQRVQLDDETLVIDVYTIEDVQMQLYGDAAVVTGVVTSSGSRNGEPFASRVRFTNLWVVQTGAWRRAAFHDTPMPTFD